MSFDKIFSFPATVKWARVFERNRDLGDDKTSAGQTAQSRGGKYKVNCFPTDPDALLMQLKKYKVALAPMGHELLREEDGRTYLTVHRYHNAPVMKDGTVLSAQGGPPRIVDADGNEWDPEVNIGDGSLCEIVVEAWTIKGKDKANLRLKAIKVLEHVSWQPNEVPEELAWVVG